MAKQNKFKRIRKIATVAEHNRKYALQQAEDATPEAAVYKATMNGGMTILPPEMGAKPATPSLGQLFSFCK